MKGYKGFDKDLKCRGFQYEIGKEYEEDDAQLCICGFHACENPIDVLHYYNPGESRYCKVELDGIDEAPLEIDDSKFCGCRIKIGDEIGAKGIVNEFIKYSFDKGIVDSKILADGRVAVSKNEETICLNNVNRGVAVNTYDSSAAINFAEYSGIAVNGGFYSIVINEAPDGAAISVGNNSIIENTAEYGGCAISCGNFSTAINDAPKGVSLNTGGMSNAITTSPNSIAISTYRNAKAKGVLGSYIVLAEWYQDDDSRHWYIKDVKAAKVDGVTVKADTFYELIDGEFQEV